MIAILQKSLKMKDIREKARALNINPGRKQKAELIHAIQKAEGNTPCFGTGDGHCPNTDCCFMKDCLK